MHFPFPLFIRWFASASNVLTAMSLAINLTRLEGEKQEGRNHGRLRELGSFPTICFACAVKA
jgi:hypothetical protein